MSIAEVELLIGLLQDDPVAACLLYEEEIVQALELLLQYLGESV